MRSRETIRLLLVIAHKTHVMPEVFSWYFNVTRVDQQRNDMTRRGTNEWKSKVREIDEEIKNIAVYSKTSGWSVKASEIDKEVVLGLRIEVVLGIIRIRSISVQTLLGWKQKA